MIPQELMKAYFKTQIGDIYKSDRRRPRSATTPVGAIRHGIFYQGSGIRERREKRDTLTITTHRRNLWSN